MRKSFALAALTLAACQPSAPESANQNNATAGAESLQNRLVSMPEGQRNAVFIRAIRDAGLDCQYVDSAVQAGEYQGAPLWSAHCQGGQSYTIAIAAGGYAQIIDDAVARLPGNAAAADTQTNMQGE